ncbi:MAG: SDR family NAD(P)-dependent oxidoreductase [Crocinitomicaceae bacterium]|nr:SDR family NAD(P)-dependent oxidoreductase [Crocinitomicaceae bacterium]
MNILVTGGAGYIGSHTVVELIQQGYNPIIIDDFRNSEERIIEGIEKIVKKKICFYKIDLTDYGAVKSIFQKYLFEGIIHFAAYKAVGESVEVPLKYYRNNLGTLLTVVELAIAYNVQNFIFSSSCTLYDVSKTNNVVTESTPIGIGQSPYATTKRIGEQILQDVVKANPNLNVLCMRYFNPIGAHPSSHIGELPQGCPNNLVPFITQTAMRKIEFLTVLETTITRRMVHVLEIMCMYATLLKLML